MAVQFMDSCDHYDLTSSILLKWNGSSPTLASTSSGRNGRGIQTQGGTLSKSLTHQSGWVIGWAVNIPPVGGGGLGGNFWYQGSHAGDTGLFSVYSENDGSVSLYAGNGRHNLIQNSGTNGFFLKGGSIWYWFEVKYLLSGSSNISVTATFRVNTQVWCTGSANTDINVTALLLGTATTNFHTFSPSGTGVFFWDDFVIADMSGSGSVNDFFGDTALSVLFPNADVTTNWLQSAAGSAFVLVNQVFPDDDATYIYSQTLADIENFDWQPTSVPSGGSIVAVHYGVYARKDAEGSRSFIQTIGPTGSPTFSGNPIFVGDDYAYYFQAFDQDPSTSLPWTQAGFNSTQFGVKLHS